MTNDKIGELLEMFAACEKHGDTYDYPVPRYENDFRSIVAQWAATEFETMSEKVETLQSQLPEGMKHCTIIFRECALGHGWLTAKNWIDHGCPTCELNKVKAQWAAESIQRPDVEPYLKALTRYNDGWFALAIEKGLEAKTVASHAKHVQDAINGIRTILGAQWAAGKSQDASRLDWLQSNWTTIDWYKDGSGLGRPMSWHFKKASGFLSQDHENTLRGAIDFGMKQELPCST